MKRTVVVLLALVAAVFLALIGLCRQLPGDYFYDLVVYNRASTPVEVYVDGRRKGAARVPVPACSEYAFPSASFQPGRPLRVEVRDLQGRILLETEQTPVVRETSYDYRVQVVVPAFGEEQCEQIQASPTGSQQ